MQLTKQNPNRIHAIDCRCRGCNAPARLVGQDERRGIHPLFYALLLSLAFWAAVAWIVWEAAR